MVESILVNYLVKINKGSAGVYLATSLRPEINSGLLHPTKAVSNTPVLGAAPRPPVRLK